MGTITNPILRGFNPDPSILRVGQDYFIAVSTFQWCPGVTVYHSRDLHHWRLLTNILDRSSQLCLQGVGDSEGIYAPQISYRDGYFYLVYTVVHRNAWPFIDSPNYVVQSPSITGPWSNPVYLHSRGIDPSLFHDTDGRSYLLTNEIDFRKRDGAVAHIVLQEYSPSQRRLIGKAQRISDAYAEGPHIYKRDDYYYLFVAIGGTDYNHAEEVYRSTSIRGPFESSPYNPLITSRDAPDLPLQKAGHVSIVKTPSDEWYMAHLTARPLQGERKCPLGRESALQKLTWSDDGWPRLASGGNHPEVSVTIDGVPEIPLPPAPPIDHFDAPNLMPHFLSLRDPPNPQWLSLERRPGYLSLRGRSTPVSPRGQSLVARRLGSLHARVETCLEFNPESYRHTAGLMIYYDLRNFFFLRMSYDERIGRSLNLLYQNGNGGWHAQDLLATPLPCPVQRCHMGADISGEQVSFRYSLNGTEWMSIATPQSMAELSDEHNDKYGFTGTMVGMACYDMEDASRWADFDFFLYEEVGKTGQHTS